jgi:hypothetical protein
VELVDATSEHILGTPFMVSCNGQQRVIIKDIPLQLAMIVTFQSGVLTAFEKVALFPPEFQIVHIRATVDKSLVATTEFRPGEHRCTPIEFDVIEQNLHLLHDRHVLIESITI